jgi:hypothetical protein
MHHRPELQRALADLETRIREAEARLPAHSIKPMLMAQVLALEDERDALLARLAARGDA